MLYVGEVLSVTAVMLMDKTEPRSVVIFSLFVEVFVLEAYLYVRGHHEPGWVTHQRSLVVLPVGCGYHGRVPVVGFLLLRDPVFGIIWLMWIFPWALFFVLLALEKEISRFIGWAKGIAAPTPVPYPCTYH